MYVDTGQGTVQRLDNPVEPPLENAFSRLKLESFHTGTELVKKKRNHRHCGVVGE